MLVSSNLNNFVSVYFCRCPFKGDDTDVDDDDDNSDDDDDSDTEIDDSEDIDDDNERVDNAFITEGSLSALDSPVQLLPVPRDQGMYQYFPAYKMPSWKLDNTCAKLHLMKLDNTCAKLQ